MSLISEALRKAHLEALQQDRDQRRFYMNHGGRRTHGDGSSSRTSVAIVLLASLCVMCAAALLYLTLDRSEASPATTRVVESTPPAAPAARTQVADVPPASKPAPAAARAEKPAAVQPPAGKPRSRTRAATRNRETAAAVVDPRVAAPRLQRDGFRAGETYGSPVSGPLGTEVVLTGISELRGQRIAIINGSMAREGTTIGPFVVEAIEPRRVRLKYVDVSFYIVQ